MGLPPPTGSPSEVPILILALRWTLWLLVSPLSTVIQAGVSKGDLALYKHTSHVLASSLSRESSLRKYQGEQVVHGLCPRSNGRSLCRYSCLKPRVAVVAPGLDWYIPTRKSLLFQIRLPSAFPTQKALPDPHIPPSNPGLCSRVGNHTACNNLMGFLINLEPCLFLGSPWSRNVGS